MTSQICECLFCDKPATARFSAPLLKPRFLICDEHLESQLAWAAKYRRAPGRVIVERIAP